MNIARKARNWGLLSLAALAILWLVTLGAGKARTQGGAGQGAANNSGDPYAGFTWKIDAGRGPVDLGLTDPALVGAIDVHEHLDPDAPGSGGQVRALDAFDAAILGKSRGMRGIVFKAHQDVGGASAAYLVRKHVTPGFEMFGRMASNMSTGGINVAALEHFSQIKGGWGRIYEMPTRDTCGRDEGTEPLNMDPKSLAQNRPWMLLMPPGSPQCVATSKNGELLPEVKYLIGVMAKIRTVDSNGRMVLATGHATDAEHLMMAKEGIKDGLHVLLTHPAENRGGFMPQLPEAVGLGAFTEMNASGIYKTEAGQKAAAALVKRIGAEHIIVGTDCGQTVNVYPTDCLALAARGMRAHGVTQHDLDMMYKANPAKLLWLPPLEDTVQTSMAQGR